MKKRYGVAFWLPDFILVVVLVWLVFFVFTVAHAAPWRWSPPAAHHAAVVQVRSGTGTISVGSGCYVQAGAVRGILTAHHVIDGSPVIVIWQDGTQSTGKATYDKYGHDLGMVLTTHPTIQPLPVAKRSPSAYRDLEFCGYGGSQRQLRHWYGRIDTTTRLSNATAYASPVLQGDSGGPVISCESGRPEVVGVISWGSRQFASSGTAQALAETGGPSHVVTLAFTQRVATQWGVGIGIGGFRGQRSQGGCAPGGSCPQPGQSPQLSPQDTYPPPQIAPSPIQQPTPQPYLAPAPPVMVPVPPPAAQPSPGLVVLDYDRLAKAVAGKMAADPRFRGPRGPAGATGSAGQQGPAGATGAPGITIVQTPKTDDQPLFYIRKIDGNTGEELGVEEIRRGEGFTFRMYQHGGE